MTNENGNRFPKSLSLPRFVRLSDLESGRAYLGTPSSVPNSFILLEEKRSITDTRKYFGILKSRTLKTTKIR